jgi:hypothetical protein
LDCPDDTYRRTLDCLQGSLERRPTTTLHAMTEIEKTEAEIKVLQKKLELLKEIETHKSQPKMEYQESGTVDKVEYNGHTYLRIMYDKFPSFGGVWWKQIERHKSPMNVVFDNETRNILEGLWFNQVKTDNGDGQRNN